MSFFGLLLCLAMAHTYLADPSLTFTKSVDKFAVDLYEAVIEEKKTGDIILSPLSVQIDLAMVEQGARGQTASEILNALDFTTDSATIASNVRDIMEPLQNVSSILKIANRVYVNDRFRLNPQFNEDVTKNFYSSAQPINCKQPQTAANTINEWVEGQTNDLIKNLISPQDINTATRIVLVNAIYFKGVWKIAFQPRNTRPAPFYTSETVSTNIPTMHLETNFNYADVPELDAQFLQIPYKQDDYHLSIILPNDYSELSLLEEKLKSFDVSSLKNRVRNTKVNLSLPKFTSNYQVTLNNALEMLGMRTAFTNVANFSGLLKTDETIKISKVIHKAFIEVDEQGTKAAAATAAFGIRALVFRRPAPVIQFNANRPFYYFIENKNSVVFFVGRFTNQH